MLGAQPVRPIDLAAFYAAIANEGKRPTPHVIESITQDGREVYKADEGLRQLASVDPAAVFQLRTILQGVVARGTAARISALSSFVGGKTGTSDDFNDAWFVGFSNDVTIAVWVGYDNAKGKRTLGSGQAGGKVALPIFEPIMQGGVGAGRAADAAAAALARGGAPSDRAADRRALRPAARRPRRRSITASTSAARGGSSRVSGGFMEYFRVDDSGRLNDTQDRLASRGNYGGSYGDDGNSPFFVLGGNPFQSWFGRPEGPSASASRAKAARLQRAAPADIVRSPPAR